MADQVYPAFMLDMVNENITKEEVMSVLLDAFKENECKNGRLDVKLVKGSSSSCIIVNGVDLPWPEIKTRLGERSFGSDQIRWRKPDIGLERMPSGLLNDENYTATTKLLKAFGYRKPFSIFDQTFVDSQLGGVVGFSHSIRLLDAYDSTQVSIADKAGLVLQKRPAIRPEMEGTMEVEYQYRLEAIQSMCMLCKTNEETRKQVGSPGVEQSLENKGLGIAGAAINVSKYMTELGYVPFSAFDQSILNKDFPWRAQSQCKNCLQTYSFLGVDGDLRFIAANCCSESCKPTICSFSWSKENFIRLIPVEDAGEGEPMVLQIQGLRPNYTSVEQFKETAANVSRLEFQHKVLKMGLEMQTICTLLLNDPIDEVGDDLSTARLTFRIEKNGPWDESLMTSVTKVRVVDKIQDSPIERYKADPLVTGRLYSIQEERGTASSLLVTLIVSIRKDIQLAIGQKLLLIPQPNTVEKMALRSAMAQWTRFQERRQIGKPKFVIGSVVGASSGGQDVWGNEADCADFQCLSVAIPEDHPYAAFAYGRVDNDYIGAKITMKVTEDKDQANSLEVTIPSVRVVDVYRDPAYEGLFMFEIFVPLLSTQLPVLFEDCSLQFYRIVGLDSENKIEENIMLAHGFEDDLSLDENPDSPFQPFTNKTDPLHLPMFEEVFFAAEDFSVKPSGLEELTCTWRFMAESVDLSIMDLLIHSDGNCVIHDKKPAVVKEKDLEGIWESAVYSIENKMNNPQLKAMTTLNESRLSVIDGAPGTGKSWTCANAAVWMYCKQYGQQIICAPTNAQVDVLFQNIKLIIKNHALPINVIRMYTKKEEQAYFRNVSKGAFDPLHLHQAMRKSVLWKCDTEVNLIMEKDESMLTQSERIVLAKHTRSVEMAVLNNTDIVLATIEAAIDQRLDAMAKSCRDRFNQVSVLYIDGANEANQTDIVPLLTLQPQRVCLLGDTNLMRKEIFNPACKEACLDISWMEFLPLTEYIKNNSVWTTLKPQYRMARQIANVIDALAMNGSIANSDEVMSRDYESNQQFQKLRLRFLEMYSQNISIYTYNNICAGPGSAISSKLETEGHITTTLLSRLIGAGIPANDIVVLLTCKKHVEFVKWDVARLQDRRLLNLVICTLEEFKGKERSVVILNTVRCNTTGSVDVLAEKRRMTETLSRAKDYIFLVNGKNNSELAYMIKAMQKSGAAEVDVDFEDWYQESSDEGI